MKKESLVLLALLAFAFVGCKGLDNPDPEPEPEPNPTEESLITLETTKATLNHGETFQIIAECETPITYSSENVYYATVSESGLVTAGFVGNTNIVLETEGESRNFEVTIAPVIELYPEPEIEIGERKQTIVERFGTPDEEVEGTILYSSYAENAKLKVSFDEKGLVDYYAVVMNVESEEVLGTFLGERYLFFTEEEGVKTYINALNVNDATLLICPQMVEGPLLMVVYKANDGSEGGGDDAGEEKGAHIL